MSLQRNLVELYQNLPLELQFHRMDTAYFAGDAQVCVLPVDPEQKMKKYFIFPTEIKNPESNLQPRNTRMMKNELSKHFALGYTAQWLIAPTVVTRCLTVEHVDLQVDGGSREG